jgi:chemotaxis protein MotB
MKSLKPLFLTLLTVAVITSCVSKKKYLDALAAQESINARLTSDKGELTAQLNDCDTNLSAANQAGTLMKSQFDASKGQLSEARNRLKTLQDENDFIKKTNTNLLNRLEDLSVISKSGAESIKQSLTAINGQSQYIRSLTNSVQKKDSMNLALVMNLKRSLSDINDDDVQIEVKKGVVYVSLSDKLLFRSASAYVQPSAQTVLGKIAKVVKDHKGLEILVEGHTDNVPISTESIKDNWDLSVLRATAVVRILQDKYGVDGSRMTAGGRSEFVSKTMNDTREGRSLNRRTEIILLPKLDQFFGLMSPASTQN